MNFRTKIFRAYHFFCSILPLNSSPLKYWQQLFQFVWGRSLDQSIVNVKDLDELNLIIVKLERILNSNNNNSEFDRKSRFWGSLSNSTFKFDQIWSSLVEFDQTGEISSRKYQFLTKKVPFRMEFGIKRSTLTMKIEFDQI